MSEFTSEWKETKVVMSVEEYDRYRQMERAIKERKIYRVWSDAGVYGKETRFSVVEENEMILELGRQIDQLNQEKRDLKKEIAELKNRITEKKTNRWWN